MNIDELALDLGKKLEVGDRQKISDVTGINRNTVYAIFQGRKIKPIGKEKIMQVLNEAIDILKAREKEVKKLIDKAEGI